MAYGDYNGPDKPDKGKEGGSCNRTSCQAHPADYYNHGSMSWYCFDCMLDIGNDTFNMRDWQRQNKGYPMFETREMMEARKMPKTYDNEDILEDNYPVYLGYYYVVDGKVISSGIEGDVGRLKRNLNAKEIRRCNAVDRGLPI